VKQDNQGIHLPGVSNEPVTND